VFSLDVTTVGNTPKTLNLTLSHLATADNTSLADLVTDINNILQPALRAAGLSSVAVTASAQSGALLFSGQDPSVIKLVVHNGTTLGFAADQASVSTVALSSAQPAGGSARDDHARPRCDSSQRDTRESGDRAAERHSLGASGRSDLGIGQRRCTGTELERSVGGQTHARRRRSDRLRRRSGVDALGRPARVRHG
jgi:hypothetical protein